MTREGREYGSQNKLNGEQLVRGKWSGLHGVGQEEEPLIAGRRGTGNIERCAADHVTCRLARTSAGGAGRAL